MSPAGSSYSYVKGDVKDSRSLQLTRAIDKKRTLQIMICSGEVRILPSKDGQMHLNVELRKTPAADITAYVRAIDLQEENAIVSLAYPKELHPFIVLRIPPDNILQTVINLATGELSLRGNAIQGDRQIDIASGKLTLFLRSDSEYSTLEAIVGLGSVHDRRPGGATAHFPARQFLQGKGAGRIEAKVASGSIELRPEE